MNIRPKTTHLPRIGLAFNRPKVRELIAKR